MGRRLRGAGLIWAGSGDIVLCGLRNDGVRPCVWETKAVFRWFGGFGRLWRMDDVTVVLKWRRHRHVAGVAEAGTNTRRDQCAIYRVLYHVN